MRGDAPPPAPDYGALLAQLRRCGGWSAGELAEDAGLSPNTIRNIETGAIGKPRADTHAQLRQALVTRLSPDNVAPLEAAYRTARRGQRSLARTPTDTSDGPDLASSGLPERTPVAYAPSMAGSSAWATPHRELPVIPPDNAHNAHNASAAPLRLLVFASDDQGSPSGMPNPVLPPPVVPSIHVADWPVRILVADNDVDIRDAVREFLTDTGEGRWEVVTAAHGQEALRILTGPVAERPRVAILDVVMPALNGDEILVYAREHGIDIPIILFTALGSVTKAVQAMQVGAFDYFYKPIRDVGVFLQTVADAIRSTRHVTGDELPLALVPDHLDLDERVVGRSSLLLDVVKSVGRIAREALPVLLTGEPGTGKDEIAALISRHSGRSGGFVKVDCAVLSDTVLASQLFGHAQGWLTNAVRQRDGAFLKADKGTILLDAIGELSPAFQAKLLRVLHERTITPLGTNEVIPVDVRIVATTQRDLSAEVQAGRFREELFRLLSVAPIHVPTLRDREEDIPRLAYHFLCNRPATRWRPRTISQAAMDKLLQHEWPGNVRELKHVIEHVMLFARGLMISPHEIEFTRMPERVIDVRRRIRAGATAAGALDDVTRHAVIMAMLRSDYDMASAARRLNMVSPGEFESLLARVDLRAGE